MAKLRNKRLENWIVS